LGDRFAIQELSESDHKIWDDLVQNSDQGTVFHEFDWLKLMEKYTDSKLILLTATYGDEIFAGIPLFLQESYACLIKRILSPPYPTMVHYLGPIFNGYNHWKENIRQYRLSCFQKKLDEYLQRINPHSILIVTPPNMLDMRSLSQAGYLVMPKYTYVADVSDLKHVWKGFKKKLRSSIMKAEKNGLRIEEANLSGYNLVTHLLSDRIKEKGQRLEVSSEYLFEVYRTFHPKNLRVVICGYEQEDLGGLVSTQHKDKVTIWLCATEKSPKFASPTDLLYWETIKWTNENGYRYCEILFAESQVEYKSKYNFGLVSYFSARKMRRGYSLIANTYNIIRNRH